MKGQVTILILAAGSSSRMKDIKQLLPWGKSTLLEHSIQMALKSQADKVFVVLGANREIISKKLDFKGASLIVNENWEAGMGESLAKGVTEILKDSTPEGILIMLCDQPLIDFHYLDSMIHLSQTGSKGIIGTAYESKIGVPAIFRPDYYKELQTLEGDKGAGSIIRQHGLDCMPIDPAGKEVDIDTETSYRSLHQSFGSSD